MSKEVDKTILNIQIEFSPWLVGDGIYPMLSVGDQYKFSFEMYPRSLGILGSPSFCYLKNIKFSVYEFTASVTGYFNNMLIAEVNGFVIYICHIHAKRVTKYKIGDLIKGEGELMFGHGSYEMNLNLYKNPPDLFQNFRVERMTAYMDPEANIVEKDERGFITKRKSGEIDESLSEEVNNMEVHVNFGKTYFYLIYLTKIIEESPVAFID
jgi:hypothetical protein